MTFRYMLAPLEDTSDNALRELCFNHGADLTFTEMTRLRSAVDENKSSLRKISIINNVPTQIQFAVQNEFDLKKFLDKYNPSKNFKGINLNLGCPSPQLINLGMGCAMIKRVSKVNSFVKIIQDYGYGSSVKLRLGLNAYEKKMKSYLNLITGVDADFFIVHARHGAEHYEVPADYRVFPEIVATGKMIIANGDVDSIRKVNLLKKMGVAGAMIGRAAVTDPAIFERLKGQKGPSFEELRKDYTLLAEKYFEANGSNEKYKENVLKRLGKKKVFSEDDNVQG